MIDFTPQHEYLVGIDSDGCAFDTMELKHKECFIPNIINYWGLQGVSRKKESLAAAAKYPAHHTLMIGDAPGDHQAAAANHALFFPVNPGAEDASWQRFCEEGIERFLSGTFAGEYQAGLLAEFDRYLPHHPPWKVEE